MTDYAASNLDNTGVVAYGYSGHRADAITDGTSNTVFVGMKAVSSNSYTPGTFGNWDDPGLSNNGGSNGNGAIIAHNIPNESNNGGGCWGSPYSSGAPLGMYDGSVRMLPFDSTQFFLYQLLTPNAGDIYTGP